MEKHTKILTLLYHLSQAADCSRELTPSDWKEFKAHSSAKLLQSAEAAIQAAADNISTMQRNRKHDDESFAQYSLPNIIDRLRPLVMHGKVDDGASDVEWLMRFLLVSPALFKTTRQLDNFLANITGCEHITKSTGRDRIVDWYLRQLRHRPDAERDTVIRNIAKHIFVALPSRYQEWNAILFGE